MCVRIILVEGSTKYATCENIDIQMWKKVTIRFPLMPLQAMFIENIFLLLASSWMFTMVSWDTVGIPAAVFCSFLIGETHSRCLHNTVVVRMLSVLQHISMLHTEGF